MKKFCKIISIFIAGLFCATTFPVSNLVENAKAEIQLDEEFINVVLENLTSIASEEYWMGREYGTPGEREAVRRLENLWNNNIAASGGIFQVAELEPIDKGFNGDYIDQKLGIWDIEDYSLNINGEEISKYNCYPITNGRSYPNPDIEYSVKIPTDEWLGLSKSEIKDLELYNMELEEELKKENILNEVNALLLNDCTGISGELIYIEDYKTASISETEGRIHLIEIDQSENDDVFQEKVDNVYNSNGTAFIGRQQEDHQF